ncbi:MAG TPA: VWA domain-containing protein [Pyrinomonadaceae bacterium]
MRFPVMAATAVVLLGSALGIQAQSSRTRQPPTPANKTIPAEQANPPQEQDSDPIKIDTNLVSIPVIASTRSGMYVPDLRKEDFSVFEDGLQQEIAFFATVNAPFHVVLMLDTSASTQEKLREIQNAAIAFVEQLQGGDRVKVISFDDQVRDLNEFSSDKSLLSAAIRRTRPGMNTKLYDAMQMALAALYPVNGRKAIVLFSDGVDWHSDRASFDDALRALEESGIIVYPIRYDTRPETERLARQQAEGPELPTSDVIRSKPGGTTPPTFPSEDPLPIPGRPSGSGSPGDLSRLPPPSVIFSKGRPADVDPGSGRPGSDRLPDVRDRAPSDPNFPGDPGPTTKSKRRTDDSITHMLDQLYLMADSYLMELATRSGGRIARADTVSSLPEVFKNIAAELRTQYSLGYYPAKTAHDGSYRKIQVKTTRKEVAIRAKPGYRAPSGN